MLNSFTFNGRTSTEFGIKVERMPSLNRSARKFRVASVSGHNGNIYELEDAFEEVIIPYQIFAGERNANGVGTFTDIVEWLHSANGYAVLTDTYDPTHYREAVFVDSLDIESAWHTLGRTTINFRCRPERYIVTNPISVTSGGSIANPTAHNSFPKITLTGGGARSLFRMADREMGVESKGIINSRQINYSVNNMDTTVWMVRRRTTNDPTYISYAGTLYGSITSLTEGALTYPITSDNYDNNWGVGFTIPAQPNTDYTLSWEAYNNGRVEIWCATSSGYHDITNSVYKVTSENGWASDHLTFRTPDSCGYLLISLGHLKQTTLTKTSQQYKNVMLVTGKTVKPFMPYAEIPASTLTINDTTLTISTNGFATAVIDCDKENVTIDGVNGNPNSVLTDQYGNLSASYLQMLTGVNTITFSGDITAVSVEPRFWNL